MKSISSHRQAGAVSLFVVVFATLLITVVTVSFLRLMIGDQNRASNNDLSQSAYDSAQAGVEDGKRVLLRYQKICNEGGQAACDLVASQINDVACNEALRVGDVIGSGDVSGGGGSQTGEIKIQQTSSSGDVTLDQAYTCVTIELITDDYLGSLSPGESKLVPLIGESSFDRVTIQWFSADDVGTSSTGANAVNLTGVAQPQPLLGQTSWPINRPSVLRTQLMQFGNGFTLGSFDATTATGQSNANTVFMYPTSAVAGNTEAFTLHDQRTKDANGDIPQKQRNDTPLPVRCEAAVSAGGYACTQTLILPEPINGGDRTAFLRLTPFYNATHFRATLSNGGASVRFDSVQPIIDSTGRANDLFRRVSSRVDLIDTSFPYPDAAVDLTGNLCKDFSVTDTTYVAPASGACTP
ncbi:MAG: hypothetical protein WAV04_00215 [Candidatus Microsaccharimonas sp.]